MKTQLTHYLIQLIGILYLVLIFSNLARGQNMKRNQLQTMRESLVNNSDYILQGSFWRHCSYFVDEHNMTQSIDIYIIGNVLRGPQELKNKKIVIIRETPNIEYQNGEFYPISHFDFQPLYMNSVVQNGILFCKRNTINSFPGIIDGSPLSMTLATIPDSLRNDNLILQYTDSNNISINRADLILGNLKNHYAYYGIYKKYFKNIDAVYNYLKKYSNIQIPSNSLNIISPN